MMRALLAIGVLLACIAVFGARTEAVAPLRAPAFTLTTLAGTKVSLAQHRGKLVLVNFWATWCVPCRTEMPWLVELNQSFPRDLVVLGVAMDEEGAKAAAPFVQRYAISFPILLGDNAVADRYQVEALPASMLIDRGGMLVSRVDGPIDLKSMRRRIQALIDSKATIVKREQSPYEE